MFDASQMAHLAETYYAPHVRSIAWSEPWDGLFVREMLEKLSSGSILLVPYDVDKNHEPCMSGGKKAHWVAVKGFVLPILTQEQLDYCKLLCEPSVNCTTDSIQGLPIFHFDAHSTSTPDPSVDLLPTSSASSSAKISTPGLSSGLKLEQIIDYTNPHLEQHLRLITQQSKSKHQGVWTYTSLRDSNHNLMQFDEDRVTDANFKVPSELSALRGKAVFVSPKTNPM